MASLTITGTQWLKIASNSRLEEGVSPAAKCRKEGSVAYEGFDSGSSMTWSTEDGRQWLKIAVNRR